MTPTPTRAPRRFVALDALRGGCALMVVGFHLNAASHLHGLFARGYVGVDFFFVLSGFIIAAAYGDRVGSLRAVAAACARRLGRLYPLHLAVLSLWLAYVVALSVASGHSAFKGGFDLASLTESILLLQGFSLQPLSWNFTAWSISLELWLNVGYFLMVMLTGRWAWLAELALALLALAAGAAATFGDVDPTPWQQVWLGAAHYGLAFLTGVILLRLYRRLDGRGFVPPTWLAAAVLAVGAAAFLAGGSIPDLALPVIFGMVVLVLAFDAGPIPRALAGRAGQWLGTISYSIYLTHPVFTKIAFDGLSALGKVLHESATRPDPAGGQLLTLGGPWVMDLVLLTCLATVIASAGVTYRLIEDPARRAVNALSVSWFGPLSLG